MVSTVEVMALIIASNINISHEILSDNKSYNNSINNFHQSLDMAQYNNRKPYQSPNRQTYTPRWGYGGVNQNGQAKPRYVCYPTSGGGSRCVNQ